MPRVLSSRSRLEKIVADILPDINSKPRLMDGRGNAMLVAGSIYEACKFYELFAKSEEAAAETIENNVHRLLIDESPVDPTYYEKMSKLLDALIAQRRKGMLSYKEYLEWNSCASQSAK